MLLKHKKKWKNALYAELYGKRLNSVEWLFANEAWMLRYEAFKFWRYGK